MVTGVAGESWRVTRQVSGSRRQQLAAEQREDGGCQGEKMTGVCPRPRSSYLPSCLCVLASCSGLLRHVHMRLITRETRARPLSSLSSAACRPSRRGHAFSGLRTACAWRLVAVLGLLVSLHVQGALGQPRYVELDELVPYRDDTVSSRCLPARESAASFRAFLAQLLPENFDC